MTTITKQNLADKVADLLCDERREEFPFIDPRIPQAQAKHFVETFFDALRATLSSGENIKLSGFGNFELRQKTARPGRNPKTGEVVPVKARRVVVFKSGQKLRKRVEKSVPVDL